MGESEDEKEPSIIGVFDHILSGGAAVAEEAIESTVDTVTYVPQVAASVVSGVTDAIVPDILPDMDNIDKTVKTADLALRCFIAFSVAGTTLFSLRIVREIGQWRQWFRYRTLVSNRMKKTEEGSK